MSMATTVLVTGGCGFVGRHLVRSLLADGHEVWVVDNLFSGIHPDQWMTGAEKSTGGGTVQYQNGASKLVFIEEDAIDFFRSQLAGKHVVQMPIFEEVYHLAAVVGGRAVLIEENPMLVSTNHVIDSWFWQWAVLARERIGRVLYISSSVSYPKVLQDRGANVAMKENMLDLLHGAQVGLPESIYGWIKLAGEYLGVLAAARYGMKVVNVRPFSGYGGDQDESYPIPSIAARVARREDPLIVWGSGDQGRDFIYIDDFVDAMRLSIRKITDGSGVNIGCGRLTTFKQVAQILAEAEGYVPVIQGRTDKAEGSFAIYADPALLYSLGWKPRYTVEQGFAEVLRKVKERQGR